MFKHEIGKPYIPGRTQWPQIGEYNYRGGQHELRLFFSRLSAADIAAIRDGLAEFALVVSPPAILFLYQFGRAAPWSDAPYSIHMIPAAERTPPAPLTGEQRALLQVILVSAEDGTVRALRTVSMAPAFSAALHTAIAEQLAAPFDQRAYDRHLALLYQRNPRTPNLLGKAVARCAAGD